MPSIIEGYNYDIFISYRQKDNKHGGWVTEFVDNLKGELESTFKEEISVYFDNNPKDGLLETHDVDASLKEKLKCLVFIPIVSLTYCDPKSYAWEHEFKAFVNQASQDQYDLKIKLLNGNVACRVLPVQIYDLDNADIDLCESTLGGALRGIEFIYKSAGVNRPLKPLDNPDKNINKTFYRDQINKVANAVKEIISGIKSEPSSSFTSKENILSSLPPIMREKSIIVLPFENMSSDPDQEYFSDGLTEEIITDLSHIHDLLVISRSSAMTFKGSKKKIKDISCEVNVKYVLEGSVRKSGKDLRIIAQLIDGTNDSHIWAEKYSGTMDDIFDIQEKVSRSIVDSLKLQLRVEEKRKISERPIQNPMAYEYYLKAKNEQWKFTKEGLDNALIYLQKGIDIMGENVHLLAGMGYVYYQYVNLGIWTDDENIEKIEEYAQKVFALDPDSPYGHLILGLRNIWWKNPKAGVLHFKKTLAYNPNDFDALGWSCAVYANLGKKEVALSFLARLREIDPISDFAQIMQGFIHLWVGDFQTAIAIFKDGYNSSPGNYMFPWLLAISHACNHDFHEANMISEKLLIDLPGNSLGDFFLKFNAALKGNQKTALDWKNPESEVWAWRDFQASYFVTQVYSVANARKEALVWLEHAVDIGMINYPFIKDLDPLLENIRYEEQFEKLLIRVKEEWENFEV